MTAPTFIIRYLLGDVFLVEVRSPSDGFGIGCWDGCRVEARNGCMVYKRPKGEEDGVINYQ